MRKSGLLLAAVVLVVLLASGVAWAATINCSPDRFYCGGTNERDTIYGTDGRNRINAWEGNDRMIGKGGVDLFNGGNGNDVAKGGSGADRVPTSPQILGDDRIYGGPGNDTFSDEVGRNLLSGGPGADYLYGHSKLVGGRGDDYIKGYARNYDTTDEGPRGILGGAGRDLIRSEGTTNDTIYISDGERDTVGCGGGKDTVYFDKGVDKFIDSSGCENRIPK
ncbi:MAG TPA: calcium-binding protein [Rubrobacter sp.]|nr:calcium-binding protein [Rubrobacter sp.]